MKENDLIIIDEADYFVFEYLDRFNNLIKNSKTIMFSATPLDQVQNGFE
jgi:hypothetical protein